jgi:hypothetical protein
LVAALAPALGHAQFLSPGKLSAAHAKLEGDGKCQSCHAAGAQISESRCVDCHKDIGVQRKRNEGLHGKAFRADKCESCHVEHLGSDNSLIRWPGLDPNRFDHSKTGWPLRDAHQKTECTKCHDKRNERGVATYLGADRSCASCHKDPHDKRFGQRCNDCHNEARFDALDLSDFDHDLARFDLDGAHARVACAECHGKPPQYKNLEFQACSSCHEDPHAGQFEQVCTTCHNEDAWSRISMPRSLHPGLSLAAGHSQTPCKSCHDRGLLNAPARGSSCVSCHKDVHDAPFGDRCEQCHSSIRFLDLPVSIGRSAHARTPFALRGEHARAECESCHTSALPVEQRYRGLIYNECAACHEDAHDGSLTEYGDCAVCHDPLGFAPSSVQPKLHAGFGFALEGNHVSAACSACHRQTGASRTHFERPDKQCHDCHENPHGQQFAVEMSNGGCAHCHNPQGWGLPQIDHTVWPLTGAHASAPCSGCHRPNAEDKKAGRGSSYKGVPKTCEGCHDDVHGGQFSLSEPAYTCDHCHQTERFALPEFDHAKLTSYPLTGKHRETSCASCHPIVHLRNGDDVTNYRLGYQECVSCHADPHTLPKVRR